MELKSYLRGLGLGIIITAVIMGFSKNRSMTNEEIIAKAKQLGMTENTVLTEMESGEKSEDEAEGKKADVKDADAKDADSKDTDSKESDTQGADAEESDAKDADAKETDAKETDAKETDVKENAVKEAEEKANDAKNGVTDSAGEEPGKVSKEGSSGDLAQAGSGNKSAGSLPDDRETGTDTAAGADAKEESGDPGKTMVITIGSGDGSYSASRKLADVGAVESADEFDDYLCNNGYDKKIRAGTYTIPANASNEQMAKIITGAQ